MPRRRSADTPQGYLSLRPVGAVDAIRLYACFARAWIARAFRPPRFRGAGRYLVGSRPVTVQFDGLKMKARPRSEDLLYLLAAHKPSTAKWFRPMRGEFVVDAGAHVGYFSVLAARAGAHVLAIEPNPATRSILEQNLSINGFMDVRVASQALGVGPGKGTLEVPVVYDGKSSLVPGWAAGNEGTPVVRLAVDIASLDQVVADAGFDRLDWLLIDVEGAEVSVLRGARQTLRATRRVIIEVARSPMLRECRQILVEEFGFRIVATEEQNEFTEYWYAVRPQVAPAS